MKRMKRWISLVLALSLMLSACPVSVSAETEETEAAVLETAAATEAATESPDTMETVSELPETTEATELPETTAPAETTESTEPEQTTASTEPAETTATTEPAEETTEATEPSTQPPQTEAPTEPAETLAKLESMEITVSQNAALAAAAASGTCGESLTWVLDEEGVLTISGEGEMSNYSSSNSPWYSHRTSITALALEEGITRIGDCAFYGCSAVTGEVRIPDSVKTIGYNAFSGMTKLTSVVFGQNLSAVGDYKHTYQSHSVFYNSTALQEVTFTGTNVTRFWINPFSSTTALKKVYVPAASYTAYRDYLRGYLPDSARLDCHDEEGDFLIQDGLLVAYIGEEAEVTIPDTVTAIETYAFDNYQNLTKLVMGSSVKTVGDYAFAGCANLADLTLGSGVEIIGNRAFYECSNLSGTLVIPDSVKTIDIYAFYNCSNLTGLRLGDGLEAIGNFAFYSCSAFTGSLVLPASLTTIGECAFYGCSGFTGELYIPDSVTSIGQNAFCNCSGFSGSLRLSESLQNINQNVFYNCSGFTGALVIPDSVKSLASACFKGMSGITSVTLGSSLTSMSNPFSDCTGITEMTFTGLTAPQINLSSLTNLKTVYVPAGVFGTYQQKLAANLPEGARLLPTDTEEEFLVTDGVLLAYLGEGGDVVIGQDLGVEIISSRTFQNCTNITSVTIPDTVTVIEDYVFDGCTGLTTVAFPQTLTSLGSYAFQDCSSLITVDLPDSLTTISSYAFHKCTALATVAFPQTLTAIGSSAFRNCTALTTVDLPDSLTTISSYAFYNCTALTTVAFSQTLTSLGSSAFRNCTALTAVDLPDSLTTISSYAFYRCTGLTTVDFPDTLTTIGSNAFYSCTSLTAVIFPGTLINIDNSAFYGCRKLIEVDLPDVLTTIGEYAFQKCTGLETVSFSNALTSLGKYAFQGCISLTAADLPETLTSLGQYAFQGCTGLTTADLSSGLTTIDAYVFQGCGNLVTVTLPASLTSIGDYAFQECTSLETVAIPETLTTIGQYAFQGCTGLTTADLSGGLTSIGIYAFQGCTSLTAVDLPETLTSLGQYAFQGCTGLTTADLSSGLTTISDYAFRGCTSLVTLTLPEKLTTIGQYAFQGCSKLAAVTLPDTLTTIQAYAFSECVGLTAIEFPAELKTIGNYAFHYCRKLTGTLKIPEQVTKISPHAFSYCTSLTGLDLGKVTSIGSNAFRDCSGLTGDLVIPDSVTIIDTYAFYRCSGVGTLRISNGVKKLTECCFAYMSNLQAVVCGENMSDMGCGMSDYFNPFYMDGKVKEITFLSTVPPTISNRCSLFSSSILSGVKTIYVAAANLTTYKNRYNASLPAGVTIQAYDDYSDFILEEGVLIGYAGEGGEVKIPDSVTAIGDGVFRNNTTITEVTIPDTVTSIGENAFQNCTALEAVNLPAALQTIGAYAFSGCSGLTGALSIPAGVTAIANRAFNNCSGLTGQLTLPATVTAIGDYAFYGCKNLSGTLTICGDVTTIGEYAFSGCSSVDQMEFQGKTVPKVKNNAIKQMSALTAVWLPADMFSDYAAVLCEHLPTSARLRATGVTEELYIVDDVLVAYQGDGGNVVIPEGVSAIGPAAFQNCGGLTAVTIPDTVTDIGAYAFYHCCGLTGALHIPAQLVTLGRRAFCGCTGISGKLTFPDTVVSIGEEAFSNAFSLTELDFGAALEALGDKSFYLCRDIREVTFRGLTPPVIGNDTLDSMAALETVYVPAAAYRDYMQTLKDLLQDQGFRLAALDAQDDFLIENGVLLGYSGIGGEIVIPEGVTAIADRAFINCAVVTKLTMPDTVTEIGHYAFYNCGNLTEVVLSQNLQSIGEYAFYGCSAMTGLLDIPDSVKTIGAYAFYGDKSLTGLTLGNSVMSIGACAFMDCSGMKGSLLLPDSLTSLGSSAFDSAGFDGNLILPKQLTTIAQKAFYQCGFSGALTIPGSVGLLYYGCFGGMTNLTSVTFAASFGATIKEDVFNGCSGITEITFLPLAVPALSGNPFSTMTSLENVYVPTASYDAYVAAMKNLVGSDVVFSANFLNAKVPDLRVVQVYSKTAMLEWSPHISEAVVGYRISRDGVVVDTTSTCSFTDRNLTLGQTYTYCVQGYTAEGETSAAAELTVTTAAPKVVDLKTANGSSKVNESSNTLRAYVSHSYSLEQMRNHTGVFYYERDGQRILMGEAVVDENLSGSATLVYTLDWALEDLAEGDYDIVFCVADPDGTVSEYSKTITIDRSVPEKIASVVALDDVTRINVNWTISTEVDTNVYRIYRRAASDEQFQLIAQINKRDTLTYADTNVRTDRIYFYYVVGVNPLGQEGEPSEIAGATLMQDTTEPVVNQLTPANGSWLTGEKTITLQAEDNVQVVRAELHYSVDAGETWALLAELSPGNWKTELDTTTLEDGVIRMKAIAWDAAGNASRELIYDYAIDNTGPQQVKNLSYSSTNVTATLRWSDVADPDLQYFRVERKMSSGIYQKISDVTGTLGVNLYNLTPGTEYTYRVVAYDRYGNRGIPSEDITVLTKSDFTPPVITAIQPAPGYYAREIPVEITASDEHSVASITLQISTDRISWQNVYTQEYTAPSRTRFLNHTLALNAYSEGSLYVRAVAKDAGGNESDIGVNAPLVQYIVDRTAPAAPKAVTAEGGCGYVEISWKQGSEQDLSIYSVYRANSSGGTYTRIASGLRTVNYYDRSVQEETDYYYKVLVQDMAGNESAFSQVVSASAAPDTEKPKILTIYPSSGSTIGPGNCEISVAASDNSALASVKIEYSTDGETYITLCELTNLVSHGDYAAAKLPITEFTEGQTIHIRASARDKAGNESDAFSAAYSVDATAPGIWSASASFDTDHVLVTWTGKNEPDLSNYQIYREEDGTYTRIAFVNAESGKQDYSFRDTGISAAGNLYTYKVEAVDRCGNRSWVVTEAVEIPDRQFPRAVISCDNTMQAGVEYLIDASGSSDNTGIASWFFDFGDGTTGTEPKAVHCYAETGSYTITLTVTDLEGHQNTVTKTVTVVDRALLGTIKVFVRDEYGTAVPGASVYLDLGEENQAMKKTDNEGYALFTAQVGTHTLGCIIPDNQWLPAKKDAVVIAGGETAVTMTMVHQPLIQGEFEVNRMTFEEIVAAGIDVQDPANQHMVRVNVSLTYGESQKIDTSFMFNMTTRESPDTNIRIDTDNDGESDREFVPVILGGEKEDQIAVAYLDLPIGTSFLKEFFDVNLHIINNASSDFSMTDNVITLNVPEGMSLVPAAGKEDHALVKVPEIPGQTSKTVSWILRGDQEGTYQLSANYSGILSAFGEPIYATFLAKEPLKVYGPSAVKLIAEINSTITNDAFHFNLALENVSDIDVNMPSVEVLEHVLNTYLTQEPAKEEENQPEIWNPEVRHLNTILQNASGNRQHIGTEAEVTTLRPDERITKQYAVYNVVGFNNVLHLRNAIAQIADSVGLKVEIIETDMDLYNTEDAAGKLAALSGDKKALYDYILRNDQFFYVMESVHRDQSILDSIALNSFGSAREKMNIDSYADEARSITRKFVAQLLLDASMQEAIADRAESKYLEVAAAGIRSIHSFLNDAEGAAAEAAQTGLTAYVQQANTLQKLAASVKNKGYQGFVQDLLSRLEADGMAADAADLIRQHCESDAMAADLEEVFQAAYEETDVVLEKIGDLLENWYDSATLLRDMAAICAAYEESTVLLEMLETNLDPSSPAVQEIQAIRSALESVKNSQIAGFLDQMGSAEATEETVKKYLDASFGTSVGAGYTLAKLVFGEAYDALTWNGFSDGRHVLQLNTDLSFAMTDAVLHHGLGADSQEEAVYTLKALKYLIKLRMLGEQNYVNYCGSMSDADQAEHLSWVNQNMGAAYDSLQDYASEILALLSEYRDTIFTTYYTRVDIPEAPQVTIDYLNSATKEVFSAAYEYRFGDTQWITCTGTTIPIQPGTVPKSLQVRQKETASSFAGNVTKIVIPAMPRLTGDISVSRTGGNYQITGLKPGSYRYGFVQEASLETLSNTLTVVDDKAVTLMETGSWVYLAIRRDATETAFASQVRYLAVETLSDGISGTCGKNLTWTLDENGTLTVSGQGTMEDYTDASQQPWYEYRTSIISVVIENGVTRIGNNAFAGIAKLSSVILPGSLRTVAYQAFADCTGLVSITIPEGVTSIGSAAFFGCTNLTDIDIPASVTSISSFAFYNCVRLTSVTIPEGMTKIPHSMLAHCSSLSALTIPDGVKEIEILAVAYCSSLTSLTIPGSVTKIDTQAFCECTGVNSITFEGDVPTFGTFVFSKITATAYYPADNPTWTEDKLQNYDGNLTWKPYCSAENSVTLDAADLSGETSVWIDGVEYPVQTAGDLCYVELPDGNAKTMVSYTYHTEDSSDPHSQYPVGMKVWTLTNENGKYIPVRQADFDDILRYSGMSIRVTGKQGIRMITAVDLTKKNSLISGDLAGYTLKEYGTVVAWADQVADQPLVLGKSYVISAYAYRKGIADPVFAYDGNRMQYTNVLVGFREDQCSDDLAMRPYMILADAAGNEITLYGGIVHRSIGYIAYQNRNTFASGTEAYQYVWDIIHNVYGDLYDEEYAA